MKQPTKQLTKPSTKQPTQPSTTQSPKLSAKQPINERAVAVQILLEVTENAAYANQALRQTLARHPDMDTRGRAFVTELVNGTLRNLIRIDHILDHFSKTPAARMKPFIRAVLRVGVYQLRCMDRVPPSAAVNEAVRLVKARGFSALSGFVNAVLRAVDREPDAPAVPTFSENAPEHIRLRYSYPAWLVDLLIKRMGLTRTLALCEADHQPPPVTVCVNPLKTNPDKLTARLLAAGVECEPGGLFPECLKLRHVSDITGLEPFAEGWFHVMDEGALAAVKALGVKPGQRVLDMCAAPGGKTFAMAYQMADTGWIRAFDIHPHKIKLMEETVARLGLTAVSVSLSDASVVEPTLKETADAVLLDAPCSGLGILRKRPDIKYARTPQDIPALAEKQRLMLSAAAEYVKPGGVLVYCACTLTREENIDNIRWFTTRYPFRVETPPDMARLPGDRHFIEDGCVQLWPGPDNDGFFIARLVKDKGMGDLNE